LNAKIISFSFFSYFFDSIALLFSYFSLPYSLSLIFFLFISFSLFCSQIKLSNERSRILLSLPISSVSISLSFSLSFFLYLLFSYDRTLLSPPPSLSLFLTVFIRLHILLSLSFIPKKKSRNLVKLMAKIANLFLVKINFVYYILFLIF
jgi:hypothetical protein